MAISSLCINDTPCNYTRLLRPNVTDKLQASSCCGVCGANVGGWVGG